MHAVNLKLLVLAAVLSVAGFSTGAFAQTSAPKSTAPTGPAPGTPNVGSGAKAPPSSGPDMTTETYGDWIMRCQKTNNARNCEVSQTIIMQGQSAPLALIAFGREKKGDPLRMVIRLPTNVSIDAGVKALTASGESFADLKFRRCFAVGCFSDTSMSDAQIGRLRSLTEPLSIKFKDGTEREISFPLSPKGIGPALDALSRS